ncbi:type II toxin-antitoxin system RelE/ParE family toxin [Hoeflea ulvae]|uniref:Type II toxin-antitoxin system RelE/ParE family toxin n=1 Tax=Hoeflea ulvae TaxID=2983764 RepID=A0ABT3YAV1_9HYPH|nr:type II toxin-antitoxin system RelE/ParE family toxin [Hoeflea ulvae]MCY0092998.1 type II toxin-antitoxin system RelE/ParE family toxin [Hoeflea ulvae]
MKRRDVVFAPEARADVLALYDWISAKAGSGIAIDYIERIERFCNGLDLASERGHSRYDIRSGLRVVGFEKRITIAFIISDHKVTIMRLFYGGQNWENDV